MMKIVHRGNLDFWMTKRPTNYMTWIRRRVFDKFPEHVDIELTSRCGLLCPACPRTPEFEASRLKVGDMRHELVYKCLGQAEVGGLCSVRFGHRGDPVLVGAEDLHQYIKFAKTCPQIMETRVTTNGTSMTYDISRAMLEARLDVLHVYLHVWPRETPSESEAPNPLEVVLDNMKYFISARNHMRQPTALRLDLLAEKRYEPLLLEFTEMCRPFADEIRQGTAKDVLYDDARPFGTDTDVKPVCDAQRRLIVMSDGTVTACTRLMLSKHNVGDLNKDSLTKIWQGNALKAFRERVSGSGCERCHQFRRGGKSVSRA